MRPGKKPTSTAAAGNWLQCATTVPFFAEDVAVVFVPAVEVVVVGVCVANDVACDVELGDFDEVVEGLDITQLLFWQEYPRGQHAVAHFSKEPLRSVLCNSLEGELVTFCFVISQLIGVIVLQSVPEGQHIADLLSLKATHVELVEQQKSEGRPALLHGL